MHEDHVQLLEADVVDDLVVGALEEGRVDRRHRLHALERQAGREQDGVLLGDAHVVVAVRQLLLKDVESGAGFMAAVMPTTRSSRRLGHQRLPEDLGVLRPGGRAAGLGLLRGGGAVEDRARLGGVPLLHALEAALLGR